MKLTDMKYTAKDKAKREKTNKETYAIGSGGPDYPYGLCLTLDSTMLEKLGIDSLPKPGKTLYLEAKAVVVSVRSNSNSRGQDDRSMELQLQKLAVDKQPSSASEAVDSALDDLDSDD